MSTSPAKFTFDGQFSVARYSNWVGAFQLWEDDTKTTPVDISDATDFILKVRWLDTGETEQFTTLNGMSIDNAPLGQLSWNLVGLDTTSDRGAYTMWLTFPAIAPQVEAVLVPLMAGTINIEETLEYPDGYA